MDINIVNYLIGGLCQWPALQLVLFTLVTTHLTIISVTVFLHRHQAHRALEINPLLSHLFRFWLWLTTGIVTQEWVAVHR
ncbi:MAG TPA: acyl-CoA desaturase, partial [Gammaproteobacteria bacterium]|nr:acyl-CoA desaturase [Gammaproteobacteria bacterium]